MHSLPGCGHASLRRPHPLMHGKSSLAARSNPRPRVIIPRSCIAATPRNRTGQWDRPRWCHNMALVRMGCRLYIAGSAAGYTLWGHRTAPHACKSGLGASSNQYLTTCYASLVHGYAGCNPHGANGIDLTGITIDAVSGGGVQVILCGVCCMVYLAGPRILQAPMEEGMAQLWSRCPRATESSSLLHFGIFLSRRPRCLGQCGL